MRNLYLAIAFACLPVLLTAQDRTAAFEMNERLGRGINIGNTFEAPTEQAWSNPWNPEYPAIIGELGFQHVRVPINWDTDGRTLIEPPYTIDPNFFERIQGVIDAFLAQGLHVIINMHHHHSLFEAPDENKARFLAQWAQIAEYFQDYSDSLLFEVLNEPNDELTPAKWNLFFADALEQIRQTNPNRMVLMGTADWGGLQGMQYLELPDDPNLIVTVHYYNPFTFTHQGAGWVDNSDPWLGTVWRDTEADRETIANEFEYTLAYRDSFNIPIHVGEFGAYSNADLESRVRWTTFLSRWFEEQDLSWAYWEFSAGFGIYDPSTETLLDELVDALLVNGIPEPLSITADTIYVSDFSSDNDGWTLNASGGAAGNLNVDDGLLHVAITELGDQAYNLQLLKGGITLEKNRMYRATFTAWAHEARAIDTYIGQASDPWSAYSGYNGFSVSTNEQSYSYSFTMTGVSDAAARAVFDLGNATTDFFLSNFTLEQLSYEGEVWDTDNDIDTDDDNGSDTESSVEPNPWHGLRVYPIPASQYISIHNPSGLSYVSVIDNLGRILLNEKFNSNDASVCIGHLPQGIYILRITDGCNIKAVRIVIE